MCAGLWAAGRSKSNLMIHCHYMWKGFKREHEDYRDDAYRMHAFLHECLLGCCNMYVLLRASTSQVTHAPHVVCDPAFTNLLHAQTYKSLLLIKTCYFEQHVLAVKLLIDWLAECEGGYWFLLFFLIITGRSFGLLLCCVVFSAPSFILSAVIWVVSISSSN